MRQTPQQLRAHFEIERELADRLRHASKEERRALYGVVYGERTARIPHHPLVTAASDPSARALLVAPQVRLLRRFVRTDSRFLEIGAGDAAVTKALAPFVRAAIAVDVNAALVYSGSDIPGFDFYEFNGFDLPLPAASIDVAYSNDVVEHLHPDDLPDHLDAVRRVLVPGGCYVCVTPNRLSGPHDVSRHFSTAAEGFHLREYSIAELAEAMAAAGFRSVGAVISIRGHAIARIEQLNWIRHTERIIETLPAQGRRRAARPLAAVKLIARA